MKDSIAKKIRVKRRPSRSAPNRYIANGFSPICGALNDIGVVIIRLNNERSSVAFYVTDFALHGLERMFRWYVHERLSFGIP